jgi:hypothetical protein
MMLRFLFGIQSTSPPSRRIVATRLTSEKDFTVSQWLSHTVERTTTIVYQTRYPVVDRVDLGKIAIPVRSI